MIQIFVKGTWLEFLFIEEIQDQRTVLKIIQARNQKLILKNKMKGSSIGFTTVQLFFSCFAETMLLKVF